MENKTARIAALLTAADRLGRKFEAQDVANYPKLGAFARDWMLDLERPTEEGFLLDMWIRVNTGELLSLGQIKGVLNTAVARERRAARPTTPQAPKFAPMAWHLRDVANGRYRVEFGDGSSIAVRLSDMDTDNGTEWARKQPKGTRNVSLLTQGADGWTGSGWVTPDGVPQGRAISTPSVVKALEILAKADSVLQYGVAFARLGNQCYICGRNLDTAESIDAGYGPVCADKYGLPWGQKLTPAAVKAAREAEAAKPQAEEPVVEAEIEQAGPVAAAADPKLAALELAVAQAQAALDAAKAALEAAQTAPSVEVAPEAIAVNVAPVAPRVKATQWDAKTMAASRKQMTAEARADAEAALTEGRLTEAQARRYVEIFGSADEDDAAAGLHYDPLTRSYTR